MHNMIRTIFRHNWFAILYINFKKLPFRQAIKLPIDVYHTVRLEHLDGIITIDSEVIATGMIKIGAQGSEMFPTLPCIIDIQKGSSVTFHGQATIGSGSLLRVEQGGYFSMGHRCRIGARCKLFCTKRILLGSEIDISWESQIFDTNFHYMQNTSTGEVIEPNGEIFVGDNCWIGNRVNIMRGAVIPDNSIVASNSLVNKNWSKIEPYSMLAGSPAKVVKTNIRRLFENSDYKIIESYKENSI